MIARSTSLRQDLEALGRLAVMRARARVRQPGPVLLSIAIVALLVGGLWSLGATAPPRIDAGGSVLTIALLVSGVTSFLSYGILFGPSDWRFLRLVGVEGAAIMAERGSRLLGASILSALAITLPYLAGGEGWALPLRVSMGVALVSGGVAILSFSLAARASVDPAAGRVLGGGIRQFDPELARAAPLVYAPLLPFLAGTVYGVLSPALGLFATPLAGVLAAGAAVAGTGALDRVTARFIPRITEIARIPPMPEGELRRPARRGVSIILPRPAAAVWNRDSTVIRRRFPWATRLAWPAALASFVALARWGELEVARMWVVLAVGLVLLAQAFAVCGLGFLERQGCRWIDRAAGVALPHRIVGRSACAFGTSVWLLVPVTFAWSWWSGVPGAAGWLTAGALLAVTAGTASTLAAGR